MTPARLSAADLRTLAVERGFLAPDPSKEPATPSVVATDEALAMHLAQALYDPRGDHLHPDLRWLAIGSLFVCADRYWFVTDIGRRTFTGVKVDGKALEDPRWLAGPPFALAETVFDEDDFEAISRPPTRSGPGDRKARLSRGPRPFRG